MTLALSGRVVTPHGVVEGVLRCAGAVVESVTQGGGGAGGWIVPGLIDVQINGAGGVDVTTEPRRIGELAAALPQRGVTAFLPTVISCAPDVRAKALAAWPPVVPDGAAVPLGLHLEGPMLSPARRGAHPVAALVEPSLDVIAGWHPEAGVRMATIAPELPRAPDVIAALASRGVVVSIGHTDATAAEFAAGRAAGATAVTHLFNAMRPFGHRDPGPIGATLADGGVVAGLICDGVHVDPVAVRAAWRALGRRLLLVTDAVAASGAGGVLAGSTLRVAGGAPRDADGVLAGSVLTLDQALRNLVAFTGCGVPDAVAAASSTPADLLGLADRGRLEPGARADVTVLDDDLAVVETWIGGELAWRS